MTDGQMAIDGEVHDVPVGTVVRIHPDTARSFCNQTDDRQSGWRSVSVGSVEDFGSYVVEE